MKKIVCHSLLSSAQFLIIVIASVYGYPTSRGVTAIQLPAGKPCAEGTIVVEEQGNTLSHLSIKDARCDDTYSTVDLLLENVSPKQICGYEVSQTQDYEYKKNVITSQIRSGIEIKPGESESVRFSGGFLDGYSYGKPVGVLKRNAFKISWLEFSDGTMWGQKPKSLNPQEQRGHDLVLRDDKEPFVAAFKYENNTLSIMSCDEYGFGGPGLKIETNGCIIRLTFDFLWRRDFSYHPRKRPDITITIKEGDILHGEFTFDSCAKAAKGIIRDENQNLVLMELSDTDTSGKRGYCSGPPDYK